MSANLQTHVYNFPQTGLVPISQTAPSPSLPLPHLLSSPPLLPQIAPNPSPFFAPPLNHLAGYATFGRASIL